MSKTPNAGFMRYSRNFIIFVLPQNNSMVYTACSSKTSRNTIDIYLIICLRKRNERNLSNNACSVCENLTAYNVSGNVFHLPIFTFNQGTAGVIKSSVYLVHAVSKNILGFGDTTTKPFILIPSSNRKSNQLRSGSNQDFLSFTLRYIAQSYADEHLKPSSRPIGI